MTRLYQAMQAAWRPSRFRAVYPKGEELFRESTNRLGYHNEPISAAAGDWFPAEFHTCSRAATEACGETRAVADDQAP
jgi:hypothetical protein